MPLQIYGLATPLPSLPIFRKELQRQLLKRFNPFLSFFNVSKDAASQAFFVGGGHIMIVADIIARVQVVQF